MLNAQAILSAAQRIAPLIAKTPLELSRPWSHAHQAEVWLKLECAQITGSFKLRGATNALLSGPRQLPIVACSAGNHALGVAHAAAHLEMAATLVLPRNASLAKIAALRRYPVELRLLGETYDEAEQAAKELAANEGYRFLSLYNDPAVIAGQGTLGREVLEQLPNAEVLLVAVGGGGLISGIGLWAKALNPAIEIIGVQATNSAAMHASLAAGSIVSTPDLPTLADGLAGGIEAESMTFPLVQRLVDRLVLVSEEQIAAAMRALIDEHHLIVEGSAAITIAALDSGQLGDLRGRRVVALLCGRNVSSSVVRQVLAEEATAP